MKNTPLHAQSPSPHRGWHSRGYLPHLDVPGLIQSITIRLCDSIPVAVLDAWKSELALTGKEVASNPRCVELQQRIERYAAKAMAPAGFATNELPNWSSRPCSTSTARVTVFSPGSLCPTIFMS